MNSHFCKNLIFNIHDSTYITSYIYVKNVETNEKYIGYEWYFL